MEHILAIDQSTSATKALLYDTAGNLIDKASVDHRQIYPQPGWVEHDAEEIWQNTFLAIRKLKLDDLLCLSITNQRETIVVFDRSGKPLHNAIVWQCRRGDPICAELAACLAAAGRRAGGATVHEGGTYVCIEGPQFSTKGESHLYRSWGVDVIGMTNATEAKLAREAQLCYATIALVTDYDCWHQTAEPVTVEAILQLLHQNAALAKRVIAEAVPKVPAIRRCACASALRDALVTAPAAMTAEARRRAALLRS